MGRQRGRATVAGRTLDPGLKTQDSGLRKLMVEFRRRVLIEKGSGAVAGGLNMGEVQKRVCKWDRWPSTAARIGQERYQE